MTKITAKINNKLNINDIELTTDGRTQSIIIPVKSNGYGLNANGGELLFLAIAGCYCNDIYREAEKKGLFVESIAITVTGEFRPEPGSIAENILCEATITADASEEEIEELIRYTDTVAEIPNSIRTAIPISLSKIHAIRSKKKN